MVIAAYPEGVNMNWRVYSNIRSVIVYDVQGGGISSALRIHDRRVSDNHQILPRRNVKFIGEIRRLEVRGLFQQQPARSLLAICAFPWRLELVDDDTFNKAGIRA